MSKRDAWSWKRSVDRVCLGDLQSWCEAILDDHGYWVRFQYSPPLPSQRNKNWGTLVVLLERWEEGQYASRIAALRTVKRGDAGSLEAVYLELVSGIAMTLDRGDWETERARLDALRAQDAYQTQMFPA